MTGNENECLFRKIKTRKEKRIETIMFYITRVNQLFSFSFFLSPSLSLALTRSHLFFYSTVRVHLVSSSGFNKFAFINQNHIHTSIKPKIALRKNNNLTHTHSQNHTLGQCSLLQRPSNGFECAQPWPFYKWVLDERDHVDFYVIMHCIIVFETWRIGHWALVFVSCG